MEIPPPDSRNCEVVVRGGGNALVHAKFEIVNYIRQLVCTFNKYLTLESTYIAFRSKTPPLYMCVCSGCIDLKMISSRSVKLVYHILFIM